MSVKVITNGNDLDFSDVSGVFYNNFSPDDWDYMIVGTDRNEVDTIAYLLHVFKYNMKHVDDVWVAVTYHS